MDAELTLIEAFASAHPADVARGLEHLDELGSAALLSELGPELAAPVLREMMPTLAARRLERLSPVEAGAVVEDLGVDSAAALLRRLSAEQRDPILDTLQPSSRERSLRQLLSHDAHTAGALMDPLVLAVPRDVTTREALDRVRAEPLNAMFYVYVLGNDGELAGVVNQRELMLAAPDAAVRSIMTSPPEKLPASAGMQAIASHPGWQRLHALPVVDHRGAFIGAIRYKTLRHLERQLGRSTRAPAPEVTARALAELYGLAFAGLGEWALSTVRGPAHDGSEEP